MKKKICIIFSLFLICLLSISPIYAASTNLQSIVIDAYINEDGSAHIKETWEMDVHSGTEVYKVFNNMKESKLSNLKVSDESGEQYQTINDWDVDVSKSEKDGKAGLVITDSGYELCFGIGNYGSHVYTFEYDVSHFVKQYTSDQGLNYAFFSEMSLEPQEVKVTLSSPYQWSKDNSQIWAFGYYGNVEYDDGKVVMTTTDPVPSNGKMQLLMRMNDNMFTNAYPQNKSFEDILEDAKVGSDYSDKEYNNSGYSHNNGYYNAFSYDNDNSMYVVMVIGIGVAVMCAFVGVIASKSVKRQTFIFNDHIPMQEKKEIVIFRDIPCHKNIFEFFYLARKVGLVSENDRGGLIAAILLRWVQRRYIDFEKREEKSFGIFKKDGFSIDFDKSIPTENRLEEELLGYFRQASGANKKLETKEFERWCERHYEKIDDWFERIDYYMIAEYQQEHLYSVEKTYTKILGMKISHATDCFDASIRDEMEHVIGLKKFLEEMSLIDEKEVIEVKMWEEYLIYASILGIADKVEQQLGEMCPTFNQQSQLDTIYTMHMVHMFSYNAMRASHTASQEARSSGFGGGASFGGGGGGFSGGGGGGVR